MYDVKYSSVSVLELEIQKCRYTSQKRIKDIPSEKL
jgi:hypothetical protein